MKEIIQGTVGTVHWVENKRN